MNRDMRQASLIGREDELARLDQVLRTMGASPALPLFVSGESGVGKTTLVDASLERHVDRYRVLRIKFDQMAGDRPYSGLVEALDGRLRAVASDMNEDADFVSALIPQLAHRVGVVRTVVPALDRFVDEPVTHQPATAELAHQLILESALIILGALEAAGSRVVLVLDDFQWADAATIRLLRGLIESDGLSQTLIIGIYRTDETSSIPQFGELVDDIGGALVERTSRLPLLPLDLDATVRLTAELFNVDHDVAGPLARQIWHKTNGNPYFVHEFAQVLRDKDVVRNVAGVISYDPAEIDSMKATANVLALARGRLMRLPLETQRALQPAGLIGPTFPVDLVALVAGASSEATASMLAPAVAAGLVETIHHRGDQGVLLRFVHDRVQEAAAGSLSEDKERSLHSSIAEILSARPEFTGGAFEVAHHYASGRIPSRQNSSEAEASEYIACLYEASQGCRRTGAFAAGHRYSRLARAAAHRFGRRIEGAPSWFDLSLEFAEQALCNGGTTEAIRTLDSLVVAALTPLERGRSALIRMVALSAESRFVEAFTVGGEALADLGYPLPAEPTEDQALELQTQLLSEVGNRPPAKLLDLDENLDETAVVVAQLLMRLGPPSFAGVPPLFPFVAMEGVRLALKFGNSPWSAASYSMVGIWLGNQRDIDRDLAFEFGQLGYNLAARYGDPSSYAMCAAIHGGLVAHWKRPLRECLAISLDAYRVGVQGGEVLWAAYGLQLASYLVSATGMGLDDLFPTLDDFRERAIALNNQGAEGIIAAQQVGLVPLRDSDLTNDPEYAGFNEERIRELPSPGYIYVTLCQQALVAYLRGRYQETLDLIEEANVAVDFCRGTCWLVETAMLEALCLIRLGQPDADLVLANLDYLDSVAAANPPLYEPSLRLLEAELELAGLRPDHLPAGGAADLVLRVTEPAARAARLVDNLKMQAMCYASSVHWLDHLEPSSSWLADLRWLEQTGFERWGATALVDTNGHDRSQDGTGKSIEQLLAPDHLDGPLRPGATSTEVTLPSRSSKQDTAQSQEAQVRPQQSPASVLARSLDEVEDAVLVVDEMGVVTLANASARRLSDDNEWNPTGHQLTDTVKLRRPGSSDLLTFNDIVARDQTFAHRSENRLELSGPTVTRRVMCWAVAVADANSTIVTIRDVTPSDRLEREVLEHANTLSLGRLVAGVAHDFNNVLMTIGGSAEVIGSESTPPSPEANNALHLMSEAISHASALTRKLLTVGEQGDDEDGEAYVDPIIRQIVTMLELSEAKVEIESQLGAEGWLVGSQEIGLRSIVLNICMNALDAMPEGGNLRIETASIDIDRALANAWSVTPGRYVRIEVSDTGTGVNPEDLPHLFEPYFSTKASGRGIGLGLATVHATVSQIGGFIDVFSELDMGATFQVFLPASLRPVGEGVERSAPEERVEWSIAGRTVLVVDDEVPVATVVVALLKLHGCNAMAAETIDKARSMFLESADEIDVVLLDLSMPDGDPRNLIPIMVERNPKVGIVIFSGIVTTQLSDELRSQVSGVLPKPANSKKLAEAIAGAIKSRS